MERYIRQANVTHVLGKIDLAPVDSEFRYFISFYLVMLSAFLFLYYKISFLTSLKATWLIIEIDYKTGFYLS